MVSLFQCTLSTVSVIYFVPLVRSLYLFVPLVWFLYLFVPLLAAKTLIMSFFGRCHSILYSGAADFVVAGTLLLIIKW